MTNNSAYDSSPAWSPDGQKIAFDSTRDRKSEIYEMDVDGQNETTLSGDSISDGSPSWQPLVPNKPPVANGDSYTHYGSATPLVVPAPGVLSNDSDADGDPLSAVTVTDASNGSVTLDPDGSFSYQPNDDYVGTDSFAYKANDASDDSNVATVTIMVGAGCKGLQATITGTGGTAS